MESVNHRSTEEDLHLLLEQDISYAHEKDFFLISFHHWTSL